MHLVHMVVLREILADISLIFLKIRVRKMTLFFIFLILFIESNGSIHIIETEDEGNWSILSDVNVFSTNAHM